MMKYWLLAIVLSTAVYGVSFSIDAPQEIGYGVQIPIDIVMQNADTVYGYEIAVNSSLQYQSHIHLLNNTINSLVVLNGSIRISSLAPTGIQNGSRPVVQLNYSASSIGNYSFTITATAYAQNGSELQTSAIGGQVAVQGDRIEIEQVTTNNRTVDVQICMQNSKQINQTILTLDYNTSELTLASSTVPINGTKLYLNNIAASATCSQIALLTFNITAMPGSTIPINIINLSTTSTNPIMTQNGTVQYNSFYAGCTGIQAYRHSTAYLQVELFNYTPINLWQYSVVSNLSLTNDTNTTHTTQTANISFEIGNETDGAYQVVLLNLTAVFGSTTMQQNMQALCFINITSECSDADNDTFFSGPGCTQAILDCDDTRAGVHPNATEVCNNRDDDCDGSIDEGKVCPSSSKGGSGGGGGESSSSASSGSAAAGAASGSSAAFSNMMLRDEESFKQKEPPVEEHQPIQAQPIEYNQGQETEPKKVDFVGHLLGALVLLAAGIFLAYEHIKKKKHKRKR